MLEARRVAITSTATFTCLVASLAFVSIADMLGAFAGVSVRIARAKVSLGPSLTASVNLAARVQIGAFGDFVIFSITSTSAAGVLMHVGLPGGCCRLRTTCKLIHRFALGIVVGPITRRSVRAV